VKQIELFSDVSGREPYRDWFETLEFEIQFRISADIKRMASGGSRRNVRAIGDGCFEIKINIGPGMRIYFGEVGKTVVLILGGGDKSTQFRDIVKIKEYWRIYVSNRRL
jgi:putative addiction module killer protein